MVGRLQQNNAKFARDAVQQIIINGRMRSKNFIQRLFADKRHLSCCFGFDRIIQHAAVQKVHLAENLARAQQVQQFFPPLCADYAFGNNPSGHNRKRLLAASGINDLILVVRLQNAKFCQLVAEILPHFGLPLVVEHFFIHA